MKDEDVETLTAEEIGRRCGRGSLMHCWARAAERDLKPVSIYSPNDNGPEPEPEAAGSSDEA